MATDLDVWVSTDEHGLPVVSWMEPRHVTGWLWDRHRKFSAKCWIEIGSSTNEPQFVYRNEGVHEREIEAPMSAVPYRDVAGFSLHTSSDLYRSGETPLPQPSKDRDTYRDNLVLIADLSRPTPNHMAFLPLTLTSASRSDVMSLHAALTEVFIVNREAVLRAFAVRLEAWKKGKRAQKWKGLLHPPLVSGGRRYVGLEKFAPTQARSEAVIPEDRAKKFGVHSDQHPRGFRHIHYWHVFERRIDGHRQRWMVGNSIFINDPEAYVGPDLMVANFNALGGGGFDGRKPKDMLTGVGLLKGSQMTLPTGYIAAPDIIIDDTTLIVCLEFSDGELMPLTYAPSSLAGEAEAFRQELARLLSGGGGGDIVL